MNYLDFRHWCTEFLLEFGMHSDHCVELLAMIVAHESLGGKYRRQAGGGPAMSIYQIEKVAHDDVWDRSRSIHSNALRLGIKRDWSKMECDDRYSTFVARHIIALDPSEIPKDIDGKSDWCKIKWNTAAGKATAEKYKRDYLLWKDGSL